MEVKLRKIDIRKEKVTKVWEKEKWKESRKMERWVEQRKNIMQKYQKIKETKAGIATQKINFLDNMGITSTKKPIVNHEERQN